jgi:hypothetical protein
MIAEQFKFYGLIAALVVVAGMGVTIFVQSYMIESAEMKQKVAEGERDQWQKTAQDRSRRIKELTVSLKEREDDLQKLHGKNAKLNARIDALASDDCLDRAVPPGLDRVLHDAFPVTGEAGEPVVDAATDARVDR